MNILLCLTFCVNNQKADIVSPIDIDDKQWFEIKAYPKASIIDFLSTLSTNKIVWETRHLKLFEHIIETMKVNIGFEYSDWLHNLWYAVLLLTKQVIYINCLI